MPAETPSTEDFTQQGSRVGFNVLFLVVSRLISLALALVQTAIIIRELELAGSGQFGAALAFSSLFTVFATLGVQRLLVRDISRDPSLAWTHAWSALALVAVLTVSVMAAIALSTQLLLDDPQKRLATILAAVSVVAIWALQSPFEALLIARERMGLVSMAVVITSALKLAAVVIILQTIKTSAAAHGAIAVANTVGLVLFALLAVYVVGWQRPTVSFVLIRNQVRECFPFAVAMLCSLVYYKSDMVLLDFFQGDKATGIYFPVQRVMEPLLMMAALWGTAVFPALCRLSQGAQDHYTRLKKSSVRLALMISVPMAVGIGILAEPIISLLTGDAQAYAESVWVMRIFAAIIPIFYFNGIGQEFLYAAHRNWYVVVSYAVAGVVSVAANAFVIPAFGVPGLAFVAITVNLTVTTFFIVALRTETRGSALGALLLRTAVASAFMAAVAHMIVPFSIVTAVIAGVIVYAVAQIALRTLNDIERDIFNHMKQAVFRRLGARP